MDYACERGIPLSRFLGRQKGPEWVAEDRAIVVVWQSEQAQRCPSCGTFDWEQEESNTAWEAGLHLCVFCASVEKLKEQTVRDRHGLSSEGLKVRLYRGSDNGD